MKKSTKSIKVVGPATRGDALEASTGKFSKSKAYKTKFGKQSVKKTA